MSSLKQAPSDRSGMPLRAKFFIFCLMLGAVSSSQRRRTLHHRIRPQRQRYNFPHLLRQAILFAATIMV